MNVNTLDLHSCYGHHSDILMEPEEAGQPKAESSVAKLLSTKTALNFSFIFWRGLA